MPKVPSSQKRIEIPLAKAGGGVNYIGDSGFTYLMYAILFSNKEMCDVLLEQGADINQRGAGDYEKLNSLDFALLNKEILLESEYDKKAMMDYLISKGAKVTKNTLLSSMTGCKYGVIKDVYNLVASTVEGVIVDEAIDAALRGDSKAITNIKAFNEKYKDKVLYYTAAYCNKDALRSLFEKGFDKRAVDEDGSTLLAIAAGYNSTDVVEFLIDEGIDIEAENNYGIRALEMAIYNCNFDNAKLLVKKGSPLQVNPSKDLLEQAVRYGTLDSVKFLLNNGYTVEDKSFNMAVLSSIVKNRLNILKYLLEDVIPDSKKEEITEGIITLAADLSSVEVVEYLVSKGYPIDNDAIISAIIYGKHDIATLLINNGADFNREGSTMYTEETPLSAAIRCGYLDLVEKLIDKGADVNYIDRGGMSPLLHGASSPSVKILEYLVSKGADMKHTKLGKNALAFAEENRLKDNMVLIKKLME